MKHAIILLASITASLVYATSLRLASPFVSGAILQRDAQIVISGKASPGARVSVSFAGQTKTATAGDDGSWMLALDPLPACREGRTLSASSGLEKVEIADVLVGDVWLASGQSNMEMPLWHQERERFRDKMGGLLLQWPTNRCLRLLMTYPERGVRGFPRDSYPLVWTPANPRWLAENRFSALAYYFGKELESVLDVPVGIMAASWGGTSIAPWIPDSGWECVKDDSYVATNILPKIEERLRRAAIGENERLWINYPGDVWNEMVAPLAPYTCRGMIWYQGESDKAGNHSGPLAYSTQMKALAAGWRKEFGVPGMPILLVQLAQFRYPHDGLADDDESLAELCDEQRRFADEDDAAWMTCISDIGDLNDIHPSRKLEVALRLVGLALQHVYGCPVKADPPQAVSARLVSPGKVEISIEHGEGLYRWMPDVTPWSEATVPHSPIRFMAKDGSIHDCEIEISGDRLFATCVDVPEPVFVTHLRIRTDESNIYNASTLPLGTFKLKVEK